jgi:hypothetical protein
MLSQIAAKDHERLKTQELESKASKTIKRIPLL